ncbi:MAG: FecR family protein [Alphaproteobacteria bacterium]
MIIQRAVSVAVIALLGGSAISGSVQAAELAGTAPAVNRTATASGETGDRALLAGEQFFRGDIIATDASGQAHLLFRDETRMVVGPNSELVIDDFVLNSDNTASRFTLNATRGVFRFISGLSKKNVYEINTPVATVGVRGTSFDFSLDPPGFAIYDGIARICRDNVCAILEGTCSVVILDPNAQFDWIQNVFDRTAFLEANVPFSLSESGLLPAFRVNSGQCEMRSYFNPDTQNTEPTTSDEPDDDYDRVE